MKFRLSAFRRALGRQSCDVDAEISGTPSVASAEVLGQELVPRPSNWCEADGKVHLYRFHPTTGADAEEMDTAGLPEADKVELAQMRRAGARFYWQGDCRVEVHNITSVLYATACPYVIHEVKESV